jgi:hypothetical protein
MRRPEQRLWDRMRDALSHEVRLERVENVVTTGMPDVVACVNGKVSWIELKSVEEFPSRATTPVLGNKSGLRQEQKNWHMDWARWGGRSYVLIGVGSKQLFLMSGGLADFVNAMPRGELEKHSLAETWLDVFWVLQ